MNDPAPGAPEPATETWTYGGIRADTDGKKWHAWLDAAGDERWFARTGNSRMAVGSHYTAQVTRRDGGGISLHGIPEYAGSQAGQETRAALWTAHPGPDPDRGPAGRAGRRPPQCPGRGDRPAPGTGRPAAHRRAARRPRRLRHPQAAQHLDHPEAP